MNLLVPPVLRENSNWNDTNNKDGSFLMWGKWIGQLVAFVVSVMVLLLMFVFFTRLTAGLYMWASGMGGMGVGMTPQVVTVQTPGKETYVNFQGTSSNPLNWPDTGHLHESIRTDGSRAFSYDLPVGSEDTGYRLNVNERDASALTDAALVAGQK